MADLQPNNLAALQSFFFPVVNGDTSYYQIKRDTNKFCWKCVYTVLDSVGNI